MVRHRLDFYTTHHQFYICDKKTPYDIDGPDFWNDQSISDRMAVGTNILGIRVECYGPVKGELIIRANAPEIVNPEAFDHIVEAPLAISSGILEVLATMTKEAEVSINITPGLYRVRVYSSSLNTVEGDEGDDFYSVEIWPQAVQPPVMVIRQYPDVRQ